MRFLRTNTAVIISVGPFFDKTDGVTLETALTITNEKITLTADTDAGSAPTNILDNVTGATSGTANDLNYITGNDAGMMQLELAAADVNRLGRLFLVITDAANHVPVFHEFMVLPAMIYDAFVLGTDVLDASVTQILGTAVSTPATAGILDVNVKNIDNDAASASGTVTFPNATLASTTNITAGTIATVTNLTNAPTAGDLTATMKTSVTTAATAATPVAASVTGAVGSVTGAVGSVTGLTAATVHADLDDIQNRLPAALTANGNIKASLVEILTTALTETAGLLAGGFKKFFNIATPASTMDVLARVTLTDTVTAYTGNTPQTGDSFARLGAPAGASHSADVAAVKVDTAAVKVQTDKLAFTVTNQIDANVLDWKSATAPAMTGDSFARLGAPAGASVSADVAAVKAETAAVKLKTDNLPGDPADASDVAAAFSTVNATLATVAGYLDTEVAAIKAKTDNLPASPAAVGSAMTLTSGERDSVADALLNRDLATGTDSGSTTVRTVRQALRFQRNKFTIAGGTLTVYKEDDATSSWTATITTTAGDPVSAMDPP